MSDTPTNHACRKHQTGEDVTRLNVQAMRRLEDAQLAKPTPADRVAGAIAHFCGSMPFVVIHVLAFAAWLLFNTLPGFEATRPEALIEQIEEAYGKNKAQPPRKDRR